MLLKLFREKKGSRKKKILLLMLGTLRGGKGPAIKGKKLFLESFFPTFQRPLSSRGGGGVGQALTASLSIEGFYFFIMLFIILQDVILDLDWFWPNISIPLASMFLLDACQLTGNLICLNVFFITPTFHSCLIFIIVSSHPLFNKNRKSQSCIHSKL